MCKLTISQLHLFDFLLKRVVRFSSQKAYFQPVIRFDGYFLQCDFLIYDSSLMPIEGDYFEFHKDNSIVKDFCKFINLDEFTEKTSFFSRFLNKPHVLFEKILGFVKTQNIYSQSDYIYNVSFLLSDDSLPFLYLDSDSDSDLEYEIVSISNALPLQN